MDANTTPLSTELRSLADLLRSVATEGDGLDHDEHLALLRHRHGTRRLTPKFEPRTRAWDTSLLAEMPDDEFLALIGQVIGYDGESDRLLVGLAGDLLACRRLADDAPEQIRQQVDRAVAITRQRDQTQQMLTAARADHDRAVSSLHRAQQEAADHVPEHVARVRQAEQALAVAESRMAEHQGAEHALRDHLGTQQVPTGQELLQARCDQILLRQQAHDLDVRLNALAVALAEQRRLHPPLRTPPSSVPTWQVVTDLLGRARRPLPTRLLGPLVEAWAGVRLPADRWSSIKRDASRAREDREHALIAVSAPDGSPWRAWVGLPGHPPADDVRAACALVDAAAATGLHGVDPDGYLPLAQTAVATIDPDPPKDLAGLISWSALQRAAA